MPAPTGLWVFAESVADFFGGMVEVRDADGDCLCVRGEIGFVDFPLGDGKFESRAAVLGKIVATDGGHCRVRFRDGQEARFAVLAGWQLEFPKPKRAA